MFRSRSRQQKWTTFTADTTAVWDMICTCATIIVGDGTTCRATATGQQSAHTHRWGYTANIAVVSDHLRDYLKYKRGNAARLRRVLRAAAVRCSVCRLRVGLLCCLLTCSILRRHRAEQIKSNRLTPAA